MKKTVFLAICMLCAAFVYSQDEDPINWRRVKNNKVKPGPGYGPVYMPRKNNQGRPATNNTVVVNMDSLRKHILDSIALANQTEEKDWEDGDIYSAPNKNKNQNNNTAKNISKEENYHPNLFFRSTGNYRVVVPRQMPYYRGVMPGQSVEWDYLRSIIGMTGGYGGYGNRGCGYGRYGYDPAFYGYNPYGYGMNLGMGSSVGYGYGNGCGSFGSSFGVSLGVGLNFGIGSTFGNYGNYGCGNGMYDYSLGNLGVSDSYYGHRDTEVLGNQQIPNPNAGWRVVR